MCGVVNDNILESPSEACVCTERVCGELLSELGKS